MELWQIALIAYLVSIFPVSVFIGKCIKAGAGREEDY